MYPSNFALDVSLTVYAVICFCYLWVLENRFGYFLLRKLLQSTMILFFGLSFFDLMPNEKLVLAVVVVVVSSNSGGGLLRTCTSSL